MTNPGPAVGPVLAHPSPNFGPRKDGLRPELVVIHYTAINEAEALARLCDPEPEVSAHYLIARDGRLFQLVDEAMRAWHAGAGTWAGRGDVNSRSIGIELDNCGFSPFSDPQMTRLELLISDILARHALPPEAVIGHQDFAPMRKTDPGRRFDWRRLGRQGLAVWPGDDLAPIAPDETRFRAALAAFGYPTDAAEIELAALLAAFRDRFRPAVASDRAAPLAAADMAMAHDLATRFGTPRPVDPDTPSA